MRTGIASLGMYDHGVQRAANDRLWTAIAAALCDRGIADVPHALDRARPVQDIWRDPGLLLGQICGFPLVTDASLALPIVGIPDYAAPGCGVATHRSFVVARRDDAADIRAYRGRRAAINGHDSNTGMNLFRALVAGFADGRPYFASVGETGSHRHSITAIVRGEADIAAIDAVTYAAVLRSDPELAGQLQIVATTVASPTLPFVTSRNTPTETVAALREALAGIGTDPDLADAREVLFLRTVLPGDIDRYAPLRTLERDAVAAGYSKFC